MTFEEWWVPRQQALKDCGVISLVIAIIQEAAWNTWCVREKEVEKLKTELAEARGRKS